MKEKHRHEIEELINRAMEHPVYDSCYNRIGSIDLHQMIYLILKHLELEPDIKCRYPKPVLKTTEEKKSAGK